MQIDLPIPTICANIRSVFQLKAVRISTVIVVYAYAFKYTLQSASPIRTTIDPSANLPQELSNYFDLQQKYKILTATRLRIQIHVRNTAAKWKSKEKQELIRLLDTC